MIYKIHDCGRMKPSNFFQDLEAAKQEVERRANKRPWKMETFWKVNGNKYQLFANFYDEQMDLKNFWIDTILIIP